MSSSTEPSSGGCKALKRVVLIRLPPGEQSLTQFPANLISVSSKQNSGVNNINTATTQITDPISDGNNGDEKTTTKTNEKTRSKKKGVKTTPGAGDKDDPNMYKNYTPKQREWMLVYLGYARGLMGLPFEEKLQESIVQQTNGILAKRGRFCNINRIPSSKTLRTVWKNLWKEERTVATTIKRGGRPRIDPTLKREKRNERERRKRAAAREKKEMESSSRDTTVADK